MIKRKGGYNRYYFLHRVKAVCEIYNEHASRGVPASYIYRHYIRDAYNISLRTLYNYLEIPYARQLAEEEQKRAERERIKKMQKKMFDDGEFK